jgi:hypothetical protein
MRDPEVSFLPWSIRRHSSLESGLGEDAEASEQCGRTVGLSSLRGCDFSAATSMKKLSTSFWMPISKACAEVPNLLMAMPSEALSEVRGALPL